VPREAVPRRRTAHDRIRVSSSSGGHLHLSPLLYQVHTKTFSEQETVDSQSSPDADKASNMATLQGQLKPIKDHPVRVHEFGRITDADLSVKSHHQDGARGAAHDVLRDITKHQV